MLGPEWPEALYLPTFSHLLIFNKLLFSLILPPPFSSGSLSGRVKGRARPRSGSLSHFLIVNKTSLSVSLSVSLSLSLARSLTLAPSLCHSPSVSLMLIFLLNSSVLVGFTLTHSPSRCILRNGTTVWPWSRERGCNPTLWKPGTGPGGNHGEH